MFGQSLLSAFGSAACTTDDSNYPIANIAYYKMSDASDSTTHTEFATWDPNLVPTPNLYNGNLRMYGSGGSVANGIGYSNQSVSSGKHYWEHTVTAIGGESSFGIARPSDTGGSHYVVGTTSTSWGLYVNGNIYHNGVNLGAYMSGGFSNGDIIGAELDLDNGTLKFYKNGTGYGNAFTGLTGTFLVAAEWRTSGGANDHITNFGASSWAYNPSTGFVGVSELASYNGTATNVNFNVAGKFGNAGEFNGSSSYINISSLPELTANRSVSMWFKAVSIDNNDRLFGSVQGSNYFNISFGPTNNISAYTGGTLISSASNSISTNVWHNVVLVANGTSGKLYIDGNEVTSTTITSHTINPTAAYIGTNEGNVGAQVPNASIDQIRIFDSALNATQVTQLYEEIQCVPTIVPSDNFNAVLYNGDSVNASQSSTSVTTVGFQPDFTWIKARDNGSNNHALTDSVRGTGSGNGLSSNTAGAQGQYSAAYGYLSAFSTDGFTATGGTTSSGFVNNENTTYVAWSWKAGGAPTATNSGGQTPTSGSKMVDGVASTADFATSTSYPLRQSVNSSAGFSITTITKSSSGIPLEVPHGLNSPPELIMLKTTDSSDDWNQWQTAIGTGAYLSTSRNSGSDGATASSGYGFTVVNNDIIRNQWTTPIRTWVCYAWHSVAGYSKMGSYNGSNSPISIITGFTPAFLMVKRTNATSDWLIIDSARATGSGADALYPNSAAAESSNWNTSFDSNGFTISSNEAWLSVSGGEYIFMAFAE